MGFKDELYYEFNEFLMFFLGGGLSGVYICQYISAQLKHALGNFHKPYPYKLKKNDKMHKAPFEWRFMYVLSMLVHV